MGLIEVIIGRHARLTWLLHGVESQGTQGSFPSMRNALPTFSYPQLILRQGLFVHALFQRQISGIPPKSQQKTRISPFLLEAFRGYHQKGGIPDINRYFKLYSFLQDLHNRSQIYSIINTQRDPKAHHFALLHPPRSIISIPSHPPTALYPPLKPQPSPRRSGSIPPGAPLRSGPSKSLPPLPPRLLAHAIKKPIRILEPLKPLHLPPRTRHRLILPLHPLLRTPEAQLRPAMLDLVRESARVEPREAPQVRVEAFLAPLRQPGLDGLEPVCGRGTAACLGLSPERASDLLAHVPQLGEHDVCSAA
ncbi:hypothetical protein B0O99DRAFT_712687 [Bisporella sp. PMI_857]|nr:hypothetical protein B0O99DRAFT_712687 [Bisporella sp. PMI_857]